MWVQSTLAITQYFLRSINTAWHDEWQMNTHAELWKKSCFLYRWSADVHSASCDLRLQETSRGLSQMGSRWCLPQLALRSGRCRSVVRLPSWLRILHSLYGGLVVWTLIKVQMLWHHRLCAAWPPVFLGSCLKHFPSLSHIEAVAFTIVLPTPTVNPVHRTTCIFLLGRIFEGYQQLVEGVTGF